MNRPGKRRGTCPWPLLTLPLALAACDTFDHFQKKPDFSSPGTMSAVPATNLLAPSLQAAQPPEAAVSATQRGSLWRSGSKTFFRDPRARTVGDLITVEVNLQEQAVLDNHTKLTRGTQNGMTISNLFGLGTLIRHVIPGLTNTDPTIATTGNEQTDGEGKINRSEHIVISFAATVLRVLPNNNLEIGGSQQILVDNEMRDLEVRGIVRPEDIKSNNTITSSKIADARIEYSGHGVASDLQRPKWGQDTLTRFQPF